MLSKHPLSLVFGVAFSSALLGGLWALLAPNTLPPPILKVAQPNADSLLVDRLQPRLARPVTIALLGVDRLPDLALDSPQRFDSHSDMIALIRLDPQAQSMRLVSIPRDTRVEIPGHGFAKINRANRLGGLDLTIASLETLLHGITIDRAVRVDFAAARQVIDQLGGVELRVDQPMQYVDRAQDLTIKLEAGWQLLSGAQVMQFARYRSDGLGDIGRVQRQQQVFDALLSRLRHPAMVSQVPDLLAIVQDAIDTNLSWRELLALTNAAIKTETVQAVMLPGRFSQPDDGYEQSYWLPEIAEIDRIRDQFFATAPTTDFISDPGDRQQIVKLGNLRIALQDATGEAIDLHVVAARLHAGGSSIHPDDPASSASALRLMYLVPSETVRRKTEIVAQTGHIYAAQTIQDAIGCGTVTARSTGAIGSDITVYVGRDCLPSLR